MPQFADAADGKGAAMLGSHAQVVDTRREDGGEERLERGGEHRRGTLPGRARADVTNP